MTDDREPFEQARAAGLAKCHERRLARAQAHAGTDFVIPIEAVEAAAHSLYESDAQGQWVHGELDLLLAYREAARAALAAALPHLRAHQTRVDVRMTRPAAPDWGGEETDEGTQIYHHAWHSDDGELCLWIGPYSGGLNEGWAVTVNGPGIDVVMRCSADQAVEWAKNVVAAVDDSRRDAGVPALLPTEAETKALAETATKLGYELGRKEALADLRVVTSGVSYFALALGPLYHTRESAAEALMKLRRTS